MNSMQWSTNWLISRDMSEYSPFNTDSVDFNTDLNFSQVLSEITDLDSLHTQIFNMQWEELNEKKVNEYQKSNILLAYLSCLLIVCLNRTIFSQSDERFNISLSKILYNIGSLQIDMLIQL